VESKIKLKKKPQQDIDLDLIEPDDSMNMIQIQSGKKNATKKIISSPEKQSLHQKLFNQQMKALLPPTAPIENEARNHHPS